jgi:Phosphoesterase family
VIITYDEGGSFWDHVAPPRPDAYGYGTRMPALLISPFGRRGGVDHKVGDTTSALAFIASRSGLHSLQQRDGEAHSMLGPRLLAEAAGAGVRLICACQFMTRLRPKLARNRRSADFGKSD